MWKQTTRFVFDVRLRSIKFDFFKEFRNLAILSLLIYVLQASTKNLQELAKVAKDRDVIHSFTHGFVIRINASIINYES